MEDAVKSVILAVLFVSFVCGCGEDFTNRQKESRAIWEVKKRVENALNRGDTNALRATFAEDPVFVICNGPVVEGLDAIEKMHIEFFRENPGFETEFKREQISFPAEDVAIETVSFVDRFPGQPLRYGGDTTVYVKEGGQWKNTYIRMHTSVPDVATGESGFDREVEARAVWDVRMAVQEALGAEDTGALMELWAEDARFYEPHTGMSTGKEQIRRVHEKLFETYDDIAFKFTRLAISFPTPEVAIEDVSYVFTATGLEGTGRDTTVLVKRDGRWLITAVLDLIPLAPAQSPAERAAINTQAERQFKSPTLPPLHQFELIPADDPKSTSEGVYQVGWIKVLLPDDNSLVQVISVEMDDPEANWVQWGLSRQDVNFDGYLDVAVRQHRGAKWGRFHWYLYDPEKTQLCKNTLTKELSDLTCNGFEADPATRRIKITRFLGTDLRAYSYQIADGHLLPCRSRGPQAAKWRAKWPQGKATEE